MFEILLTILLWLGGGYFCGDFIIRWSQQHLLGESIDPRKLAIADRLNINRELYRDIKTSTLRIFLIITGPITIPKAALLRLFGGSARLTPNQERGDD